MPGRRTALPWNLLSWSCVDPKTVYRINIVYAVHSSASPSEDSMTFLEPAPAIATHALTKRFGDQTVLDGLDLEVAAGTVFALLGPNGAGKTTAVRILSTLLPADEGRAEVGGIDVAAEPRRVRERIGLSGQ